MTRFRVLAAAAFVLLAVPFAWATQQYPASDDGSSIGSAVMQWINGSGKAVPASVATPMPVGPIGTTPVSPGQYTPVSDAAATALTIPPGATYAVVCFEGTNHRISWDGTTTPTPSVGSLVGFGPGSCLPLSGGQLAAFKTIAVSAGGTFTASYGK